MFTSSHRIFFKDSGYEFFNYMPIVLFLLLNEQQTTCNGKTESKKVHEDWFCISPFGKLLAGMAEFYRKRSYEMQKYFEKEFQV